MTLSAYTEDTLVQQTTAEYLEQELGWQSVYAYNNEDFGPDSLLGRESDREVVLTRTLRAKIEEINPGLPATAYDDAVRQIVTVSATQTLAATNREKYELIKDGVQVTFRNAKGERVRQRLRVFDFDVPENNHFLCVRELWVRGDLYRRRADIVGFVNGLPLLFMELKNVLLQIINEMGDEESRAVREGLDEESLAVFDLLRKPDLTLDDIKRIKAVAVDLLETLKAEKLRINHWRDKESTRDAVCLTIQDYLWSEQTGLPATYSEADVRDKTEAVFVHVFRAYPTLPSPLYEMQTA
jgi:hypothetical protein